MTVQSSGQQTMAQRSNPAHLLLGTTCEEPFSCFSVIMLSISIIFSLFDSQSLKYILSCSSPDFHPSRGAWLSCSWNLWTIQSNTRSNFQKVVPFLKINKSDTTHGLEEHVCRGSYPLVLLGMAELLHLFFYGNFKLHSKKTSTNASSFIQQFCVSEFILRNIVNVHKDLAIPVFTKAFPVELKNCNQSQCPAIRNLLDIR